MMTAAILADAKRRRQATLARATFATSRLGEFCSRRELVAQTGHSADDWPLVILKELVDNALDAAEGAGVPPVIDVSVFTKRGEITLADNGPGIPPETVARILDFAVKVSSREAYVSPTRGAQGNAFKTLLAIPFALDGNRGEVMIEAQGVAHRIVFQVDQVRQEPRISHQVSESVRGGTRVTVSWPDSASSILENAEERFLQMAEDFAWLNPHLTIALRWNDAARGIRATNPEWRKWRACDPTSAHWYNQARLERYMAAHIARDQDLGRDRTVREFIAEFRGLSGSAKQKVVLEQVGAARTALSDFFGSAEQVNHDAIARLLAACRTHTRPVKSGDLGLIGREHLLALFEANGVAPETFKYQKALGEYDSVPFIIETAFGWCPDGPNQRRIVTGANWSVAINNPFRSFGRYGESLDSVLTQQRAGRDEPIVFVLHLACPRIDYTDRGKSAIVVPGAVQW